MQLLTQLSFPVIALVFFWLLYHELDKGLSLSSFTAEKKKNIRTRMVVGLLLWTVIISALSISGFLSDFTKLPPRPIIALFIPLVVIIWATRSSITTEILRHIPPQNIIRLQSFRFFVEMVLWMLFVENLIAIQMTFEGRNFDILAGLSSIAIAWFVSRQKISKGGLIIWNILCLGLLLNIVIIAVLSMPLPFRVFMNEPANTIVMKFPFVFLPALLVPLAYGLHFLSLKQVSIQK